MGTRVHYPEEVKWQVVKMKQAGISNKEILEQLAIRDVKQIKTWMKWYRNGETHRFSQPVGKQYKYGKSGSDHLDGLAQRDLKIRQLELQIEGLKKVSGTTEGVEKSKLIEVVESFRGRTSTADVLKLFGVPRATYYRWRAKLKNKETELDSLIEQLCQKYRYRFGHRKIRALLDRNHNIYVNRKTVQKIMQKKNLQCRIKPKRKSFINGETKIIVANELNRQFTASKPNEKWVTDITYLPYGQNMLYLSTIMDLYNNEIIAYRISDRQDVSLVLETLEEAIDTREAAGVLLHSDQGSVYTSYAFQNKAKEKSITTSMSRKGNCHDNAVIESFHSSLKSEEFASPKREILTNLMVMEKVENYICFYNQERIQEKLNYLSPYEYGKQVA
ncbi:IS3 family transposase [Brevibacillus porteri]|uniref:IS3 family transposase n=1 Tax=Brevibacillus porteri TaxID=2126350 RepID=UPI003D1C4DD2